MVFDTKGAENNVCKLCCKKVKLSASHILSEFLYKNIKDKKNSFTVLDAKTLKAEKRQSGFKEYLFCIKCENLFSKYEDYVCRLIEGKIKDIRLKVLKHQERWYLEFTGLKVKHLKHFILSLVYRAHLSDNSIYKNINLGPYKDKIRNVLLNKDDIPSNAFPIIFEKIRARTKKGCKFKGIQIDPKKIRLNHSLAYQFMAQEFLVTLIVSKDYPNYINRVCLKEDGSTIIGFRAIEDIIKKSYWYN